MNDGQSGISGQLVSSGVGTGANGYQVGSSGVWNNVPISSGGDIQLTSGKKSRKGLILFLIIMMLLLVGGGIIVWMTMGKGVNNNVSVESAFWRYANYALYGKDDDGKIVGDFSLDGDYYLKFDDETIINKADELEEEFYLKARDAQMEVLNESAFTFSDLVLRQRELLQFLKMYYIVPKLTQIDIEDVYNNGESDNIEEYIEEYYGDYFEEDDIYADELIRIAKEWGKKVVERLIIYKNNGCDVGNINCLRSENDGENQVALVSELSREVADYQDELYDLRNLDEEYFYYIFRLINGIKWGKK